MCDLCGSICTVPDTLCDISMAGSRRQTKAQNMATGLGANQVRFYARPPLVERCGIARRSARDRRIRSRIEKIGAEYTVETYSMISCSVSSLHHVVLPLLYNKISTFPPNMITLTFWIVQSSDLESELHLLDVSVWPKYFNAGMLEPYSPANPFHNDTTSNDNVAFGFDE